MLGRDYPELTSIQMKSLGEAHGCICAGKDPASPSFAYKGHKENPNEDGLVILNDEDFWLLAVADGHFGHQSSHALLEGIGAIPAIPRRLGALSLFLSNADWVEQTAGGSTLLVACLDKSNGSTFGLSFGDSSLAVLGPTGAKIRNQPNDRYLRGGAPIDVEEALPFQFTLKENETMLLYTDGINECCYRDPYRSVGLQHLEDIYRKTKSETAQLAYCVMELAMNGVDGYPGGQDNAVVTAI